MYNESHIPPLNMVLFDFALDHLTRIHRVLRMPQGHCLVVGVGGSGKASLIRLAAYTAECGVYEIMLARGYNEATFREDLKVRLQVTTTPTTTTTTATETATTGLVS